MNIRKMKYLTTISRGFIPMLGEGREEEGRGGGGGMKIN